MTYPSTLGMPWGIAEAVVREREAAGDEENRPEDAHFGERVRAAVEDLAHGRGLMAENTGAALTAQAGDPSL